jgi:hypothetical protein
VRFVKIDFICFEFKGLIDKGLVWFV